jgi:TfoX/Sxy family transcriptional regulator of competence genes
MAYDEGLAERIRDVLMDTPDIGEKKMFGGMAFMLNDYMFVGITGEQLMARVGPDNYEAALARPHVAEMDFTGRPMKGYVYVAPEGIEDEEALAYWVELCAAFIRTLPPKKPKRKKRRR